jgi:hypothetical protein
MQPFLYKLQVEKYGKNSIVHQHNLLLVDNFIFSLVY